MLDVMIASTYEGFSGDHLPLRGHLAMSGDLFEFHDQGTWRLLSFSG